MLGARPTLGQCSARAVYSSGLGNTLCGTSEDCVAKWHLMSSFLSYGPPCNFSTLTSHYNICLPRLHAFNARFQMHVNRHNDRMQDCKSQTVLFTCSLKATGLPNPMHCQLRTRMRSAF